jgi:hypothetical protein
MGIYWREKKMKKIYIICVGLLLVLSPFVVGATQEAPSSQKFSPDATTVKVGLLSPITGGLSAYVCLCSWI